MSITSNLYPPILPNTAPAFIRTESCRFYFAISDYNIINDIANVQVSITDLKTNTTALKTSLYPTGIKITALKRDINVTDKYKYYVILNPSDLQAGEFGSNQYYKIQMRFTSTSAQYIEITSQQKIAKWLNDNLPYFSEWSKVCIIRGISKPTLTINDLDSSTETVLEKSLFKLIGRLTFANNNEKDFLSKFNIKIYLKDKSKNDGFIYGSGDVNTENSDNQIDYELEFNFKERVHYILDFTYTTNFLYKETVSYNLYFQKNETENPFSLSITATPLEEYGYIEIYGEMKPERPNVLEKTVVLRRSCSKDNFQKEETLHVFDFGFSSFKWQDLLVQSGIWYKYSLYILDSSERVLYKPVESEYTICMFEDTFLVNNNIQFKLQFNPSISGFKYNTSESQQITIGSKYPYIKRNGENYYRTFSINGLVSSLSDSTDWYDSYYYQENEKPVNYSYITSKEQVYGTSYSRYVDYENKKSISNYLNPIYERLFRETIFNFLYDGKPKLFKSLTQGNILVKLSDIVFQPVQSLGRVLYSFSATATEIDEVTLQNCFKYNIVLEKMFIIVTESPALEIAREDPDNLILTVNTTGASQSAEAEQWILHLEARQTRNGKIVNE